MAGDEVTSIEHVGPANPMDTLRSEGGRAVVARFIAGWIPDQQGAIAAELAQLPAQMSDASKAANIVKVLLAAVEQRPPVQLLHGPDSSVYVSSEVTAGQRILRRRPVDGQREVEGMHAVPDGGRPWREVLAGPHPPQVARAAGALLTLTQTPTQAYMLAYQLHDAGLLAPDPHSTSISTTVDEVALETARKQGARDIVTAVRSALVDLVAALDAAADDSGPGSASGD